MGLNVAVLAFCWLFDPLQELEVLLPILEITCGNEHHETRGMRELQNHLMMKSAEPD
jgi:hypothetical protein